MDDAAPEWAERMRRVFSTLPDKALEYADLARDLAEERAAIMEYSGGLPRAKAEALAYRAHGLVPPDKA
jgi:predicted trehalose synthase